MWQAVGKYVGGKVLTAVLVVGAAATVIWFWKHPEQLRDLWNIFKLVLVWLGVVIVLPWALFFVVPWVQKRDNNVAPALMLLGFLAIDVLVALYLAGWSVSGALAWMVLLIGFLAAGVYNFLVCDFIAHRIEEAEGL
jgi:hypothetical protein